MKIYRRDSGVVVDDTFKSLGNEWSTTDVNLTSINDGLVIEHSETKDVRVLRDIPLDASVFFISVDYTPTHEGEKAGITLYKNRNESIELLEFKNGRHEELTDVKVIKNGDEYTFEMKRGQDWEFVDSFEHNFNKIGFVTKQGLSAFDNLVATRFLALRSDKLTVRNLLDGFRVELEGDSVTVVGDHAEITVKDGIVDGTLRIFDELDVLIAEIEGVFYGGDTWNLGSFLVLKKDGIELSQFDPTNLGRIVNNNLETLLEVYNPASIDALGLELQVKQYVVNSDGKVGWEWVDLAWDDNGVAGNYNKDISIERVGANSSIFFWVHVNKDSAVPKTSNSVYFTIYLKHE
ncbi:hypothetical protein ACFPRA_01300 [Sporosarcina soli]|uniref:Uncharacterized protein n=1 Tax=Sporosarcina soli TaxID=334736 RepID=A0ABW0TFN0_9BACL